MLKVFPLDDGTVAIQQGKDSVEVDVSDCHQFQVGKSLMHTDAGATKHVAECLARTLASFGISVELPKVKKLQEPSKSEPVNA